MSIHAHPPGRRALAVTTVAGACLAATLGLGAGQASAAYTAQVQAGTLHITGDAASDTLALELGAPGTLQVSVNGVPAFSFDAATFTAIDVKAGAGDDVVTGSNGISSLGRLTIDGGAGDDTLAGGDGDDVLIGGAGNDLVDGNRGNDVAQLGAAPTTSSGIRATAATPSRARAARTSWTSTAPTPPRSIDVSANGARVRLSRDVAAITMDFAGIEDLNLRTLGSADTVTVNDLSGTDLKAADVDLGAFDGTGDGAADTVIANATDAADDVAVSSDAGKDIVSRAATQGHRDRRRADARQRHRRDPRRRRQRDRRRRLRRKRSCHASTVARARTPPHTTAPTPPTPSASRATAPPSPRSRPGPAWSTTAPSRTSSSAASPAPTPSTARTASARSPT